MRAFLKYAGLTVAGLLAVLVVLAGVFYVIGGKRLAARHAVETAGLALPSDSARVAHGAYLARTNGCHDCHGADLGGQVFIDAPPFRVVASNLTRGAGGVGGTYTEADWDRTIRHGVRPDGRAVVVMPSAAFHRLSDADAADLIAYVRSVPPVDRPLPETEIRPLGRLLVGAGQVDATMEVRTAAARATAPPRGPTAAYGAYLADVTCQYCHGADLRGGQPPEPGAPPAPDLAAAGQWPLDTFKEVLRTGVLPGGRPLSESMPISFTRELTDDDLAALHAHFATLGPVRAAAN